MVLEQLYREAPWEILCIQEPGIWSAKEQQALAAKGYKLLMASGEEGQQQWGAFVTSKPQTPRYGIPVSSARCTK